MHHGDELAKRISNPNNRPDIICLQETWFNSSNSFNLKNYEGLYKNRPSGVRGGCAIYIDQNIPFKEHPTNTNLEIQVIEIQIKREKIVIINFYNPCQKIDKNILLQIIKRYTCRIIMCGDFNGHNILWGSKTTDQNGRIIEEIINESGLVILNDGMGTRLDPHTGKLSCLDLTLVSPQLAGRCAWQVTQNTLGSDHFIIESYFGNKQKRQSQKNGNTWILSRANWALFKGKAEELITHELEEANIQNFYDKLIEQIQNIADDCIPKRKNKHCQSKSVPWWNNKCEKAIQERNKVSNKLCKKITKETLAEFRLKKAIAQKTLREEKREYWKDFCNKINRFTPLSQVWKQIRKINSMNTTITERIPPLLEENTNQWAFSDRSKANLLAKKISSISSDENLPPSFTIRKERIKEETNTRLQQQEACILDEPFNMNELTNAIAQSKNTTPGQDGIWMVIISHLPPSAARVLLSLYNAIWLTQTFPKQWNHAILKPILKKGGNKNNAESYRPIALMPTLNKLMERLINNRLTWYMEKNELLTPRQSAFRTDRCCTDHLVSIDTNIRKAFVNKEHLLAIFLDFKKAYDLICRKTLIWKLLNIGIRGRITVWLDKYLARRTFQVQVNDTLSDTYEQVNGIVQGSVLSPTLFNIFVNDLGSELKYCKIAQFADDATIWKSNRNIKFLAGQIQSDILKVQEWCNNWGMRLSEEKTKAIVFSRRHPDLPNIKLKDELIECVTEYRYLGLCFDAKLTWKKQIENITVKCKKRMNILKCMVGNSWGSDTKTLLLLYRALIRPFLDYGCEAFNSASTNVKNKLDTIQYECLRICTGTIAFTSLAALQIECGEMPLETRRSLFSQNFRVNITHIQNHPAKESIQDCWQYRSSNWGNEIPFALRTLYIPDGNIESKHIPETPPWHQIPPLISTHLHDIINKKDMISFEAKAESDEYINLKWKDYLRIFTDGSKTSNGDTSAAVYIPSENVEIAKRISPISIYRAEQVALFLALQWIHGHASMSNSTSKYVIFTDSLSSLKAMENDAANIMQDITDLYTKLSKDGINVHFEWIPSHVGISGNEKADSLAKHALSLPITYHISQNKQEVKRENYQQHLRTWQDAWTSSVRGRFLFAIQPTVKTKYMCNANNRREESILNRLRVGSCFLNETLYKLNRHANGLCDHCKLPETVPHLLLHCTQFNRERMKLLKTLKVDNLSIQAVLHPSAQRAILQFLKDIQKYEEL